LLEKDMANLNLKSLSKSYWTWGDKKKGRL